MNIYEKLYAIELCIFILCLVIIYSNKGTPNEDTKAYSIISTIGGLSILAIPITAIIQVITL